MLLTCIELTSVFNTFVLSIFEWPLKTGFTILGGVAQSVACLPTDACLTADPGVLS